MVSFFLVLVRFLRAILQAFRDPELRALFIIVFLVVASGTLFYWRMEPWGFIDALYFSVITLTTIGYGDLYPSSSISKIFTICYIMIGLGIFAGFITKLAAYVMRKSPAADD